MDTSEHDMDGALLYQMALEMLQGGCPDMEQVTNGTIRLRGESADIYFFLRPVRIYGHCDTVWYHRHGEERDVLPGLWSPLCVKIIKAPHKLRLARRMTQLAAHLGIALSRPCDDE